MQNYGLRHRKKYYVFHAQTCYYPLDVNRILRLFKQTTAKSNNRHQWSVTTLLTCCEAINTQSPCCACWHPAPDKT